MGALMRMFEITKAFPAEGKYSMLNQRRRASPVCAHLAKAWRKRRYKADFIAKLSDAESEACETQCRVEFTLRCKYMNQKSANILDDAYNQVIGQRLRMIHEVDKWLIR